MQAKSIACAVTILLATSGALAAEDNQAEAMRIASRYFWIDNVSELPGVVADATILAQKPWDGRMTAQSAQFRRDMKKIVALMGGNSRRG